MFLLLQPQHDTKEKEGGIPKPCPTTYLPTYRIRLMFKHLHLALSKRNTHPRDRPTRDHLPQPRLPCPSFPNFRPIKGHRRQPRSNFSKHTKGSNPPPTKGTNKVTTRSHATTTMTGKDHRTLHRGRRSTTTPATPKLTRSNQYAPKRNTPPLPDQRQAR